jgi:4-amino-4-deoxychorismate lyase
MDITTLVNGQSSHVLDVRDRGLAYGDGVFETIALKQGQVQLWQAHRHRLSTGLMTLGIVADEAAALSLINTIVDDIKAAYLLFDRPDGVIKIIVTRGFGGRGYAAPIAPLPTRIVYMMPEPSGRSQLSSEGVRVRLCQHCWSNNAALAGIKHLNRLDQVMARSEWTDVNIHEGIMLNQDGLVISGVMSNLFIEMDGVLITPLLDQCGINGTMAELVCATAKQLGIKLVQHEVTFDALLNADSVFITNSLNGIWPIIELAPYPAQGNEIPTFWPISPLINRFQNLIAQHLSEQMTVADLC